MEASLRVWPRRHGDPRAFRADVPTLPDRRQLCEDWGTVPNVQGRDKGGVHGRAPNYTGIRGCSLVEANHMLPCAGDTTCCINHNINIITALSRAAGRAAFRAEARNFPLLGQYADVLIGRPTGCSNDHQTIGRCPTAPGRSRWSLLQFGAAPQT